MAIGSQSQIVSIDTRLENVPNSAKTIFDLLNHEGTMKTAEIAEKTLLSRRTVRYGLKKLMEQEIVTREPDLMDLRSYYYYLCE